MFLKCSGFLVLHASHQLAQPLVRGTETEIPAGPASRRLRSRRQSPAGFRAEFGVNHTETWSRNGFRICIRANFKSSLLATVPGPSLADKLSEIDPSGAPLLQIPDSTLKPPTS